jgi:hypothetical protein
MIFRNFKYQDYDFNKRFGYSFDAIMFDIYYDDDEKNIESKLFTANSFCRYMLYYLTCIMGMVEMIKFEQLKSNRIFTAIIICTITGSLKII